jgi:hypothetical protein
MLLKAITCLPCIAAQPDVMDLGDSRIMHLPFSEWLAIEGQCRSAVYDKLNRRYEQSPPVFWEKTIDVNPSLVVNRKPENVKALSDLIEQELEMLVRALHWYTGTAPIPPMRSVTYFDPRSGENFAAFPDLEGVISEHGVQRRYGESEKEYATQNEDPTISLRQTDAAPLAGMVAFTRRTQDVWIGEQYELASQSLGLCSAPGLDWPSRLLLVVGACESLLLPDRTTDLQKGFVTRFSAMVAQNFGNVGEYTAWFKLAYQLRSDLIHGRPLKGFLEKMPAPAGEFVQVLSRCGVLALCKLIGYRHAHPEVEVRSDPLWAVLDSAVLQPERFAALQASLAKASAACVSHQWQVGDEPC